jgi:hypothetical protein
MGQELAYNPHQTEKQLCRSKYANYFAMPSDSPEKQLYQITVVTRYVVTERRAVAATIPCACATLF